MLFLACIIFLSLSIGAMAIGLRHSPEGNPFQDLTAYVLVFAGYFTFTISFTLLIILVLEFLIALG